MKNLLLKTIGFLTFATMAAFFFNMTPRDDFPMFAACTIVTMCCGVTSFSFLFLAFVSFLHLIHKE